MSATLKHDEILRHALKIFYEQGFHATGVDTLLLGTGISKRTLYKHFRSKEALIEAVIAHYHEQLAARIPDELLRRAKDPAQQILSLFDIKREACEAGDYTGCFAINAKLEFEGKDAPIESACNRFYSMQRETVEALARKAKLKNPALLAEQIIVLFQGAIVSSQIFHTPQPHIAAKKAAQQLVALAKAA